MFLFYQNVFATIAVVVLAILFILLASGYKLASAKLDRIIYSILQECITPVIPVANRQMCIRTIQNLLPILRQDEEKERILTVLHTFKNENCDNKELENVTKEIMRRINSVK